MIVRVRRFSSLALRFKGLIERERKSKISISVRQRLAAWRRGFVSESVVNYRLNACDANDYLSDFARHVLTPDINERFKAILDNKLIFAKVFSNLRTPRSFFWLDRGRLFSLCDNRVSALADVIDLCRAEASLIVKPVDGGGGANVVLIGVQDGQWFINYVKTGLADVEALMTGANNAVVFEFAEQHGYAKRIFPFATNTIRILTMWDYDIGMPFVAGAVHRFGRTATIPVDNWSRGGLSVAIDPEGCLGKAVMHPFTGDCGWYSSHPDSGQQIEGLNVPGWEDICAQILQAAGSAPFLPYIGWDVVVTETGFVVLEGNNFSDVNLIQVHKPLLGDPRVRKFYEYHRVIGPS